MADKKCPFCAELIKREAIKCKHCGSDLQPPAKPEKKPNGCLIGIGLFIGLCILVNVVGSCTESIKSPEQKAAEKKHQEEIQQIERNRDKLEQETRKKNEAIAAESQRLRIKANEKKYGKLWSSFGEFEVYGVKSIRNEFDNAFITGTVVNTSTYAKEYVEVNAEVSDMSGTILCSPSDNVKNISQFGAWRFKMIVTEEGEGKWQYTIKDVHGS